jgi:glycosyltransferase involved in cell wall biosynthesis
MYPKVSVLIPLYNSEKYISETIDSVLAQTYTNWECIVVDDHSTDNSVKIVEKYCEKYPNKIKLYTNPRKGACAARNIAFEKSSGDYIQYLDADDLLSENKIEKQINLFEQYGNNIITNCRWGRFFDNNKESVKWEKQTIDRDYDNSIDWLIDSWMGNGMAANSCWLTPRPVIENSGSWNENLLINQDGEFFCRVLLNVKTIIFSPQGTVYYRSGHIGSISNRKSLETMRSQLDSYMLYIKNTGNLCKNIETKNNLYKAISSQLSDFYIRNKLNYPHLAIQAKHVLKTINQKITPQGGKLFKIVCYLLGINLAIILRKNIKH